MRTVPVLVLALMVAPGCVGPLAPGSVDERESVGCGEIEPLPAPDGGGPLALGDGPGDPAPVGRAHTIERDAWGVPRIRAGTALEAWEKLGYATAQDRLWQLEHARRSATGTLAEVFGASALAADRAARITGWSAAERERILADLDAGARGSILAYVAGANARIEEVRRDPSLLPREFAQWGIEPAAWRGSDAIAVLAGGLAEGAETASALAYLELLRSVGEPAASERLRELVPAGSARAPSTLAREDAAYRMPAGPAVVPGRQRELVERAASLLAGETPGLLDPPLWRQEGSNAVALGGEHTRSGAPLLLGGPQVGFSVPAVYWEARVEVDGASWNVFMKPGEAFLRGALDSGAFVLTSGGSDNVDLVVLELDPTDPRRYRYGDESLAFDARVERYLVLDRRVAAADPADLAGALAGHAPLVHVEEALRWRHGPVLGVDESAGVALAARRWPGPGLGLGLLFLSPELPEISRSPERLREAFDRFSRIGTGGNAIAAFEDGKIAFWHQARPIVRSEAFERRLPLPGDPEADWIGRWGPSCLATVVDPAGGLLVNWNNAVAAGWPMDPRPWAFGDAHRRDRLDEGVRRLVAEGPVDADALVAAYARVAEGSTLGLRTIPRLAAMAPADDPVVADVLAWHARGQPIVDADDDGRVDDPGVAAFEAWWQALHDRLFRDELGEQARTLRLAGDLVGVSADDHGGSGGFSDSLLVLLLEGHASAWWDDVSTPPVEEPREIVARSLEDAGERLAEEPGDEGRRPAARLRYVPLGLLPAAEGPVQYRGSINYVVDFGDGSLRTVVTPGQGGHVPLLPGEDPHAFDQLDLYSGFRLKSGSL